MSKLSTAPTNSILCSHCQKPSGFTADQLRHLHGNYELICKQIGCGKVAVRGIEKQQKFHISEIQREPVVPFRGDRTRKLTKSLIDD